ncbi:hypothetical protein [Lactococcus petauri]|uniref:hypothetical protein n=1 Tax=Lactococcus petauri TaxID=1940789 RepID=UPI001F067B43|nr:hypothetical protein [Lactococcus petauri]MCH1713134.1 hypothetical protein [Lactococcus petauri]MDT2551722.1 hypothetical protein [Lactococcus petauri]MDT2581166.1 hypothetical protein [Lactococcus petauri]
MSDIRVRFIVSEGVEVQATGFQQRQFIFNPVIVFATKYIPTSLSLAITMVAAGIKPGIHSIGFKIYSCTEGKDIFDTGMSDAEIAEGLENFVMTADLKNIGFESEGDYKIILTIDDELFEDTFVIKKIKEK